MNSRILRLQLRAFPLGYLDMMIFHYVPEGMEQKSTGLPNLKPFISLIAALTALVTAGTSLVKVLDKRLEQASYEALATSIKELQKDQVALRAEIHSMQMGAVDSFPVTHDDEEMKMPMTAPSMSLRPAMSASASEEPSKAKMFDEEIPKAKVRTKKPPVPVASAMAALPEPPNWADVKIKASTL